MLNTHSTSKIIPDNVQAFYSGNVKSRREEKKNNTKTHHVQEWSQQSLRFSKFVCVIPTPFILIIIQEVAGMGRFLLGNSSVSDNIGLLRCVSQELGRKGDGFEKAVPRLSPGCLGAGRAH